MDQTVRVFISSTFRDMHAERDHLVKVVFPELRERLDRYGVHLVDIDLRWGITEHQAKSGRVLPLCLEQIDACRPFFVGLIGQRYGWVPDDLPEEAVTEYDWIRHEREKSITELEILHGVLNDPRMHDRSFFYFRDPVTLATVPEEYLRVYVDADPEQQKQLAVLKQWLRESDLPVYDYAAAWDPEAYDRPSRSRGRLGELDDFGEQVLEDLWTAIQEELNLPEEPLREATASPLEREKEYHNRFADNRLVGVSNKVRADLHRALRDYALGQADEETTRPLMLVGLAGSGKSSALARLAQDLQAEMDERDRRDLLVVPHFVGASPRSTSLRETLVRVLGILQTVYDNAIDFDASAELRDLIGAFREALEAGPEGKHLVLVFDAVNQFDQRDRAERLTWLPAMLPPNVRIVLSAIRSTDETSEDATPDGEISKAIRVAERRGYQMVEVPPLTDEDRRTIARDVPAIAAKTLDDEQLGLLLSNPATRNPLFLRVALEELRGFGSFEDLNDRICLFPRPDDVADPVGAIFVQVTERLEEDFNSDFVREVLRLLASARRGLTEAEMRDLVKDMDEADDLFPVLRQLRPYLMRRGDVVDFFHQALWKAVRMKYLSDEEEQHDAHLRLANYFDGQPDFLTVGPPGGRQPNARKTDELPHQLLAAEKAKRLAVVLMKLPFLEAKAEAGQVTDLADDFAACRKHVDEKSDYVLRVLERAIRYDIGFLRRHPESLFQQFWNRAWWHDTPSAGRHCTMPGGSPILLGIQWVKAGLGALRHLIGRETYRPPWEQEEPRVHELVERWREEREAQPWVRFVRPPEDLYGSIQAVLRGHEGEVTHVAFSPDGARLASASRDSTVRVWSASGEPEAVLRGHKGEVAHVAFSPDGSRLASVSKDGTVCVWSAETGEAVAVLHGHGGWVNRVAFSPDGARLASASRDSTVRVWSASGEPEAVLRGHKGEVTHVAFSPAGALLASASVDGTVRVWSAETGAELDCIHESEGEVVHVGFSPDGARLAYASASRRGGGCSVRVWSCSAPVWSMETGEMETVLRGYEDVFRRHEELVTVRWHKEVLRGHEGAVWHVAFSPDGARLASASADSTVRMWSTETGEELAVLKGHGEEVRHLAFSPDGAHLASASADDTVRVWSVETGEVVAVLRGHKSTVVHVVFPPDGARLASGSWDGTVRVWSVKPSEAATTLGGHEGWVNHVTFSPDGALLASASADCTVRVWSTETGEAEGVLHGHESGVEHVAFSPEGARLASASADGTARVWSTETGAALQVMKGHGDAVTHVAFSPDGARLASASADGTVRVWSMQGGEELERIYAWSLYEADLGEWVRLNETLASRSLRLDATDWEVRSHDGRVSVAWLPSTGNRVVSHPSDSSIWASYAGSTVYLFRLEDQPYQHTHPYELHAPL